MVSMAEKVRLAQQSDLRADGLEPCEQRDW